MQEEVHWTLLYQNPDSMDRIHRQQSCLLRETSGAALAVAKATTVRTTRIRKRLVMVYLMGGGTPAALSKIDRVIT